MLSNTTLKDILRKTQLVGPADLEKHDAAAQEAKVLLGDYLVTEKIVGEEELYRTASTLLKVPFIDLSREAIRKDILFLVPEPLAVSHEIVAWKETNGELYLATSDPSDVQTLDFIEKKTNLKLRVHLATPTSLREALKQYHLTLEAEFKKLTKPEEKAKEEEPEALAKLAEDLPVVRIVDSLLDHAVFERASDIHIEPREKDLAVRYRVDGILRNVMVLPKNVQAGVVARIKILSNLKLDEHRLPQDGRFKITTAGKDRYSLRVSVFPEMDGEKIVMRLLPETTQILTLEELGFLPQPLEIIRRNIIKPHGIILVTGPTGSGKTTTLYSILGILNKPGVNIQTVEDPIEYKITGVNQSQVNPRIDFTFARGLRSILRQDPNIIMVGEIRDNETADIAIHAALTGHLVLSTLHTNDAATTLPRLVDMNIPPFLIAFTANMIVAQRLVRKICPECRAPQKLDTAAATDLRKKYDLTRILTLIKEQKLNLGRSSAADGITLFRGAGCKQCNDQGYKGRIGLYEIMEITTKIKEIVSSAGTAIDIAKAARAEGMITILEDGLIKALTGITTIEEVMRVTKE